MPPLVDGATSASLESPITAAIERPSFIETLERVKAMTLLERNRYVAATQCPAITLVVMQELSAVASNSNHLWQGQGFVTGVVLGLEYYGEDLDVSVIPEVVVDFAAKKVNMTNQIDRAIETGTDRQLVDQICSLYDDYNPSGRIGALRGFALMMMLRHQSEELQQEYSRHPRTSREAGHLSLVETVA